MKLSQKAELFVLLTLYDLNGASWLQTINHIRRSRYTPVEIDERDFPSLKFDLMRNGYIQKDRDKFVITVKGVKHLRFLCGQAGSADSTRTGAGKINDFRTKYDNYLAKELSARITSSSSKFPFPDKRLLYRERLLEDAGEGEPYKTLAQARRVRQGNYHVYVIYLDEAIKEKYPNHIGHNPELPPVYVGQSFFAPEERFQQHKDGIHASPRVRDFIGELAPHLFEPYNPLATRELAERVEEALAEKLRRLGFTVFGGH